MRALLALFLALLALPAAAQNLVLFPAELYGRSFLNLPQSSGVSTVELQNVLGRNANFERLENYSADDRFRRVAAPVGRLDILVQTPAGLGTTTCTASIVSARFIVTNNHCFPEGVRAASLLMDFYREDDEGGGNRFEARTVPEERNASLDYAVVEVLGNPASRFGTVRLDARDPQPGESLLIVHHPSGLPKHMTRGGCRAFQPTAVQGTDIRHRCDTLPGSSGSPILADATGRMLGLHYAGSTNPSLSNFNFGKRLVEIVKDSNVLAAIAEEQRRQDQQAAPVDPATRADIERRAREQAEAAAKAEVDRLKAQLDAERARVPALPPAAAPRVDPAQDWAAAETALGLTAEQVRSMQAWLEALGHDPRGVDGRIGGGTRAALRSYQKAKGLAETGHVSADVARMLSEDGPEAVRKRDAARAALAAAVRPPAPATPAAPVQPAVGVFPAQRAAMRPGTVFRDCPECPEMVVIPAGQTYLASGQDVTIAAPLAVGKFEVTFAEWDACVSAGGCSHRPNDRGWGRGRQPVMNVNWDDVQQYVAWLSQKTGKSYRLLSEAEWEYAAQAGSGREATVSSGKGEANCSGCARRLDLVQQWDAGRSVEVGSFAANAFGLHDMLGNVWEWTADCWNRSHVGAPVDGAGRMYGDCSSRVLRGGAWGFNAAQTRSAIRNWFTGSVRHDSLGFRVARTL